MKTSKPRDTHPRLRISDIRSPRPPLNNLGRPDPHPQTDIRRWLHLDGPFALCGNTITTPPAHAPSLSLLCQPFTAFSLPGWSARWGSFPRHCAILQGAQQASQPPSNRRGFVHACLGLYVCTCAAPNTVCSHSNGTIPVELCVIVDSSTTLLPRRRCIGRTPCLLSYSCLAHIY